MSDGYAKAKDAYRELRAAIGPWAKEHGYQRWAGTQAGWQKRMGGEDLLFKFEGMSFASPDTGNDLHGLIQTEPHGSRGSAILRQAGFSRCLLQDELDELALIQGAINRRRPALPEDLKKHVAADSRLGHELRALYDPAPKYREGLTLYFSYYSSRDVQELVSFIARMLPPALERFLQGRVATPIMKEGP